MVSLRCVCLSCGQANRIPSERLDHGGRCGICGAPLLPESAPDVDPDCLSKAIRVDDLPLLVDFWAPWCGPCRMMAPEFKKAGELVRGQARLVKLNTQDHPEAAQTWRIRGIPTLVLFKGGRELARRSGALPAAQIVAFARSDAR